MLRKRLITFLTFYEGVLFRTKKFSPDYRYTTNFVDLWSIDEIILVDITKHDRFNQKFLDVIKRFNKNCFVPVTVGGGIKTLDDAKKYLDSGADKVVLSSSFHTNENIVNQISQSYGSQCVILSIDFKKNNGIYDIFIENGEKKVKCNIDEVVKKVEKNKVGEILLNSIDRDGSLMGYDLDLLKIIEQRMSIPVIISGGAGNWNHFFEAFNNGADAVCTNNIYHFTEKSIQSAKIFLKNKGMAIRL